MARYIDTKQGKNDARDMEMLFDEHISRLHYQNRSELAILYKEQRNRLSAALKADVAPIIHAHWVRMYNNDWLCSNCDNILAESEDLNDIRYCSWCGAKMDEEVEDA